MAYPNLPHRYSTGLRIQWCKSRARAIRWQEECVLIQEELRRTFETLQWEGLQWLQRGRVVFPGETENNNHMFQARYAYASRQQNMRMQYVNVLREKWSGLQKLLGDGPGGIRLDSASYQFVS